MPALIGGFGKINRNIIKKYSSSAPLDIIKEKESNLREKLGAYLAGIIEADKKNQGSPGKVTKRGTKKLEVSRPVNLTIEVWGVNLSSSVGCGKFSKIIRNMIVLPPYQLSVIVGILLSDGWISYATSKSKNARLGLKQSYSHKNYVYFVFGILSHYCNSLPVYAEHVRKGKTNYSLVLTTRSLPCFSLLHSQFYVNNVKIIPRNIYELLTPVAIAHWIMGDGYFHPGGLLLCTDRPHMDPGFFYKLGLNCQGSSLPNHKRSISRPSVTVRCFSTQPSCSNVPFTRGLNLTKPLSNVKSQGPKTDNENLSRLAPYLAGLIEANGSIAVHDANSKSKKYRPKILVVFNLADEPLALKLASVTNTGAVYRKVNAGCVIWHIQKSEEVILIINLINGFMRTPKIEALHRAINWFNTYDNLNLTCLGLDKSPINSNAWLAGFSDGEKGGFYLTISKRKNIFRIQQQFKLNINIACQNLDAELVGSAYWAIFNKICEYFETALISKTIGSKTKIKFMFIIIVYNLPKLDLVIDYFDKYPLLGRKYSDYINFREVVLTVKKKEHLRPEVMESIKKIVNNKMKNKQANYDKGDNNKHHGLALYEQKKF